MSRSKILVYLLRRDLRFADNPIFYEIIKAHQQSHHKYTHLLPIYIFPAQQVEISGFLSSPEDKSPYPEARSQVGGFWRCGQHRAKFLAESVYDLKTTLNGAGSGLEVRVGMVGEVVKKLLDAYNKDDSQEEVVGVWMTGEEGVEERTEERDVEQICSSHDTELKIWPDEKYFIDEYVLLTFSAMKLIVTVVTYPRSDQTTSQTSSPPIEKPLSHCEMHLVKCFQFKGRCRLFQHSFHLNTVLSTAMQISTTHSPPF